MEGQATAVVEEEGAKKQGIVIRYSPLTLLVLLLVALEVLAIILSMTLPWGMTTAGKDIRLGLEGLIPWFLLVPVLLQLAFFTIKTRAFRTFYVILGVLIALFAIGMQYLTSIKFDTSFKAGFYMVFVAAAIAVVVSLFEAVEATVFPRMLAKGSAREIRLGRS